MSKGGNFEFHVYFDCVKMSNENEWELSKENVQPIRQGRHLSNLSAGLQLSEDQTAQLRKEKQLSLRCLSFGFTPFLWPSLVCCFDALVCLLSLALYLIYRPLMDPLMGNIINLFDFWGAFCSDWERKNCGNLHKT